MLAFLTVRPTKEMINPVHSTPHDMWGTCRLFGRTHLPPGPGVLHSMSLFIRSHPLSSLLVLPALHARPLQEACMMTCTAPMSCVAAIQLSDGLRKDSVFVYMDVAGNGLLPVEAEPANCDTRNLLTPPLSPIVTPTDAIRGCIRLTQCRQCLQAERQGKVVITTELGGGGVCPAGNHSVRDPPRAVAAATVRLH